MSLEEPLQLLYADFIVMLTQFHALLSVVIVYAFLS